MSNMRLKKLTDLKPGQKFIFISGDGYTKTKLGNVPSLDGEATYVVYKEPTSLPDSGRILVSSNEPEVIWFKGE